MAGPSPNTSAPPPQADLERRKRDLDRWHSRSRSIHFWRLALPVVIVLIAIGLVGWIGGRSILAKMNAPAKPQQTTVIRMVNPRFYGRDTHDRAFVVGAGQAQRDNNGAGAVNLQSPSVTLDSEGESPTHVQASSGVYREAQKSMDLHGDVVLRDAQGNTFTTPQATIDTKAGVVHGDQGVHGHGPLGQIVASSYGVYDSGKRIVFKGGVHARIDQKQAPAKRRRK